MKPDLTPAKPWGFHLTGHLNLPHSVGLEGKRVSKELMEKKARATGRIPVSTNVVRTPPPPPPPRPLPLTQPPQLVPYGTHLTSLHCKSSGVKDFRRKWGNAAPAILFQTLKTLASPRVVFGDSVVCGERIVPAFSGVSFEVLKGKSDRRFNREILLCGKFT